MQHGFILLSSVVARLELRVELELECLEHVVRARAAVIRNEGVRAAVTRAVLFMALRVTTGDDAVANSITAVRAVGVECGV